jgi:miniconductance mechanosensitive channel
MIAQHTLTFNDHFRAYLLNRGVPANWSVWIADFSSLFILLAVTVIIYYILKYIIQRILKRLIEKSRSKWDDYLYEHKVFSRLAMLVPPLILEMFLPSLVDGYPDAVKYINLGLKVYIILIILLAVNSFLNAAYHIFSDAGGSTSKPIKGYIQITKIVTTVIAGIIIISLLLGQSPITILAGLGAVSAILLLIFKDSILGFVAGVQISGNNMLQTGDWITMPAYNVDGIVTDISLVIVKIKNFDNSVATVPTYSFITGSFQNWRDLFENGGRRLKRYFLVDADSIRFADKDFLNKLSDLDLPEDLLGEDEQLTNLGIFRRYLVHYLKNHPGINKELNVVVRQLQPTETGIPIELLAFSLHREFGEFERFQSELFEYIFAVMPLFGLRIYQRPSYAGVTVASAEDTGSR